MKEKLSQQSWKQRGRISPWELETSILGYYDFTWGATILDIFLKNYKTSETSFVFYFKLPDTSKMFMYQYFRQTTSSLVDYVVATPSVELILIIEVVSILVAPVRKPSIFLKFWKFIYCQRNYKSAERPWNAIIQ